MPWITSCPEANAINELLLMLVKPPLKLSLLPSEAYVWYITNANHDIIITVGYHHRSDNQPLTIDSDLGVESYDLADPRSLTRLEQVYSEVVCTFRRRTT